MIRSATRTGPGMARSPFSQRRTVRRSLSSAVAAACCVASPAASRADRNCSGVMADHVNLAPAAVGALRFGDQHAIEKSAVGILDGVVRQLGNQVFTSHVGNVAFLPNFPTSAPVHLDNDVCHVSLRSYAQNIGPMARLVNGYFA